MTFNHIFISYRHESEEHASAVRKLADRLIDAGLPVELDQIYLEKNPGGPDEGWPKWCADRAEKSNCVLIVPSVGWFAAFNGTAPDREGLGAATEAHLFRQWLYDEKQFNARLRLSFVDSLPSKTVPLSLKAWHQFRPIESKNDFKNLVDWAKKTVQIADSKRQANLDVSTTQVGSSSSPEQQARELSNIRQEMITAGDSVKLEELVVRIEIFQEQLRQSGSSAEISIEAAKLRKQIEKAIKQSLHRQTGFSMMFRRWAVTVAALVALISVGIFSYQNYLKNNPKIIDGISGKDFIETYFRAQANGELKTLALRVEHGCRILGDEEKQLRVILPIKSRPANPTQNVSGVIQSNDGSKSSPIKIEFDEAVDFLDTEWIDVSGLVSLDAERIPVVSKSKLHNRLTDIDGCKMLEALRENQRYIEKLHIKDGLAAEPYTWVRWKCRVLWKDPNSTNLLSFVCPISKTGENCFAPIDEKPGPVICKGIDEIARQRLNTDDTFELEGRIVAWNGNVTLDKVRILPTTVTSAGSGSSEPDGGGTFGL